MTTSERIVDAHHHIWRLERTPWLNGPQVPRIFGEYGAIQRDYRIEEFAAEACPAGVTESVYVQINVAPGDEIEEVEFATAEGARAGLVQAVVSFVDLASDSVGGTLDRQAVFGSLRGVRQQLHWHPNPIYRFAPTPDAMLERAFQAGLVEVIRRGLHFELQVFVHQIGHCIDLVEKFPDARFVLLHSGMVEDRTKEGWEFWRSEMTRLASHDNVLVKLSGLGTFTHSCTVDDWKPIITGTVEIFGAERCMFGSNFPVEKLWTTYAELLDVFNLCIGEFSPHERTAILAGTASELYGFGPTQ